MRILVTIPHYFKAGSGGHGSLAKDPENRIKGFQANLTLLNQHFSQPQGLFDIVQRKIFECNQSLSTKLSVVVLTTGNAHFLDRLTLPPRVKFQHHSTDVEAKLLGFECLKVHQQNAGNFDYHCYLEDDLLINDPWFFVKLKWFNEQFGDDKVLMPNRFETSENGPFNKVYIDANLGRHWIEPYQEISKDHALSAPFLDREVWFNRWPNPLGPGFYLNARQFAEWVSRPYYLDYDQSFIGPIESSYTLGIIKTFAVYKGAAKNASFLELHHLDNRYLDSRIRFK